LTTGNFFRKTRIIYDHGLTDRKIRSILCFGDWSEVCPSSFTVRDPPTNNA
jgi:hypothetical protein